MEFFGKVKGFMFSPTKTFDASKPDTLRDALKHYLGILLIYATFSSAISGYLVATMGLGAVTIYGRLAQVPVHLLQGFGASGAILMFVMMVVSGVIVIFLGSSYFHMFVYAFGGRKGVIQTEKAFMYGYTPLLMAWIPVVNIIALIWSIVLEVIGIRQLHEISTVRAVAAHVAAAIIPIVVAFVCIAAILLMRGTV